MSAMSIPEFSSMLQHNPQLVHEVCEQQIQKEKTMYEELFSGDLTETGES